MPAAQAFTTLEEIAAATADYAVPMVTRHGFTSIDVLGANDLRDRIAAEIMALTGCDLAVAGVGAGGFVNFRSAPRWGLSDGTPKGTDGLAVLEMWLAAKVVAYRAAQARRVAA